MLHHGWPFLASRCLIHLSASSVWPWCALKHTIPLHKVEWNSLAAELEEMGHFCGTVRNERNESCFKSIRNQMKSTCGFVLEINRSHTFTGRKVASNDWVPICHPWSYLPQLLAMDHPPCELTTKLAVWTFSWSVSCKLANSKCKRTEAHWSWTAKLSPSGEPQITTKPSTELSRQSCPMALSWSSRSQSAVQDQSGHGTLGKHLKNRFSKALARVFKYTATGQSYSHISRRDCCTRLQGKGLQTTERRYNYKVSGSEPYNWLSETKTPKLSKIEVALKCDLFLSTIPKIWPMFNPDPIHLEMASLTVVAKSRHQPSAPGHATCIYMYAKPRMEFSSYHQMPFASALGFPCHLVLQELGLT